MATTADTIGAIETIDSTNEREKVEVARVGLTQLLNKLKVPISALTFTLGLSAMGIGAYKMYTQEGKSVDRISASEGMEAANLEILAEISLLIFGSAAAILGVGMNLVDLRTRWIDGRIALAEGEKAKLRQELEEMRSIEAELKQKATELGQKITELEQLQVRLEQIIESQSERITSLQDSSGKLNAQLRQKTSEIGSLNSTISSLENRLSILRARIDRFAQYEDATLHIQSLEMAAKVHEMVDVFLRASKFGVNIKGQGENGAYLVFGVNPDLTQNLAVTRTDLELMTAQWLGDNVPDEQRAYNEAVLLPLLEQFERVEGMMKQGLFESTYTSLLKLRGKIELLSDMNQAEDEKFTSPEIEWRSYVMREDLPVEWLKDEGGQLIDFFDVLEIDPTDEWSEEFKALVKSAYRKLSIIEKKHPDHGGDPNEFRILSLAKRILEDEKSIQKYLLVYEKFNILFNN